MPDLADVAPAVMMVFAGMTIMKRSEDIDLPVPCEPILIMSVEPSTYDSKY